MKKWIIPFTLLLSFAAHAGTVAPTEAQYLDPNLVTTEHLAVKAMQLKGFTGTYLTKMQKALALLEVVVNSEEFKDRVINYKNKKGQRQFASNEGQSNEQIYETFMAGVETLQPDTPFEMNFYLNLYYKRWSKVIGWTTPDTNQININSKYFYGYEPHEVAGNLAHEWTHKIGYGHASASEHDSAPYAIGYIVEELGKKFSTSPVRKVAQR